MQQNLAPSFRVWAALCLAACLLSVAFGQDEGENGLTAKMRLLPGIGPGLRAVRRGADGRIYVLASPSPGLAVFDAKGQQVLTVGSSPVVGKGERPAIVFGEDCDVDAEGHIYVADQGADAVQVLSRDGSMQRSIPVHAPVSVAALGDGEVAVATLREPHLVIVFDKNGRDVREFGDPEQISVREDLNRFLNIGKLATDAQNHLYYAFQYMPEPTVRQYDRHGYDSGQDVQYTAVEAAPEAQAVRREIVKQEKHQKAPVFKRVLTGVGVNPLTGEVWMAVGNTLLRFDKEGSRRASYKLYTPEGARLEANTILIEPDALIIGSDPRGIYRFDRPDKKN
jgi:DNA-binding beta-propeller fold protein YncE